MSEKQITIEATERKTTGKNKNKQLRRSGKIPAVILDKGKSTMIEMDPKNLSKAWLGGKKFTLSFGGQSRMVKIHELCIDPVKRTALHCDLVYVK